MTTIYFNFLILLIGISISSPYLHAENIVPTHNIKEEQDAENIIQKPYSDSTIEPSFKEDELSNKDELIDIEKQYERMIAQNNALSKMMESNTKFQKIPTQQLPNMRQNMPQTVAEKNTNSPPPSPLPEFTSTEIQNNHQTTIENPALTSQVFQEKCKVVCGQYSNYIYAVLITSIIDSTSDLSKIIQKQVDHFTNGKISSPEQCSIENLTPQLSGKNKSYAQTRYFPGMPKPQLFYRVCKKQCLSGKDGIIFQKDNPVIAKLLINYDVKYGKKEDRAFEFVSANTDGGFE